MISSKIFFITTAVFCIMGIFAYGQTEGTIDNRKGGRDVFALGAGTGVDYGGLGFRMISQPDPNFGIFVGAGLFYGRLAANAGIKLRVLPKPQSSVSPYLMAMYGRNEMEREVAKGFRNRFSVGAGVDFFNTPKSFGYITLGANYALLPQVIYITIGLNVIAAKGN